MVCETHNVGPMWKQKCSQRQERLQLTLSMCKPLVEFSPAKPAGPNCLHTHFKASVTCWCQNKHPLQVGMSLKCAACWLCLNGICILFRSFKVCFPKIFAKVWAHLAHICFPSQSGVKKRLKSCTYSFSCKSVFRFEKNPTSYCWKMEMPNLFFV